MEDQSFKEQELSNIGLLEMSFPYLINWKWFLISLVITLGGIYIYLRYATPIYKATSSILVRDESKGGVKSQLSAFQDMGLTMGIKNNVDNEIVILKSRTLIAKTVNRLNFNVTYLFSGKIKETELYNFNGFNIEIESASKKFLNTPNKFTVRIISKNSFNLVDSNETDLGDFNFGTSIIVGDAKLVFRKLPESKVEDLIGLSYIVLYNPTVNVANSFGGALTVETFSKTTSVVNLSFLDGIPEKAEDFLNTLVTIYNEEAIKDKNMISENTQKFIQERLKIITAELGSVEGEVEGFKRSNKLTDISTNANIYLENYSSFEKSLVETETQLRIVEIMMNFMKNKIKTDLIPNDIIPADKASMQNPFVLQYNNLILQRNRIIKDGTQKNYVLVNLDQQIEDLNQNIKQSLLQLKVSLSVKKVDLEKQDQMLSGKINQIPSQEREFRIIDRQQKIKEGIYLYLIQKREETAIALAGGEPNAKIIDAAFCDGVPISLNPEKFYSAGLLAGLLIPFLFIYFKRMVDHKIKSERDLDGKMTVPFLGGIPKAEDNLAIIEAKSRSGSAEAIRMVRTNLEFLLGKVSKDKAKTVFVTSSISKEGKTFVSVNLASTIALSGKKTLLVGGDIRNQKLDSYFELPKQGLTNFLAQNDKSISEYIITESVYLDILPSGSLPPNPVELLLNETRVDALFEDIKKKYDYIIVDTAPVNLVTDTFILAKYADATVFVIRADFSEKSALKIIEERYKKAKLPNMGVVLNGIDISKSFDGYGYGYGYGYGSDQEKLKKAKKLF